MRTGSESQCKLSDASFGTNRAALGNTNGWPTSFRGLCCAIAHHKPNAVVSSTNTAAATAKRKERAFMKQQAWGWPHLCS